MKCRKFNQICKIIFSHVNSFKYTKFFFAFIISSRFLEIFIFYKNFIMKLHTLKLVICRSNRIPLADVVRFPRIFANNFLG